MNLKEVRTSIEGAEELISMASHKEDIDGQTIGAIAMHLASAKAELNHVKVRDEDKKFIRRILFEHIEKLEREWMGVVP